VNAYYLYGFTTAGTGGAAEPPHGGPVADLDLGEIDGGEEERSRPVVWTCGKLAAVVRPVATAEFCGPTAEKNLQDVAWLAPRACRHQAVLDAILHRGAVWPARFGTLFSSLASLGAFVRQHETTIAGFLTRTAGHEEWAVQGWLDRARAETDLLHGLRAASAGGLSPGLAYLQERRLHQHLRGSCDERITAVSDWLADQLGGYAQEATPRRILSGDTASHEREMVWHWAFLLPRAAVAGFRERIDGANATPHLAGLSFEISGPWPAASFCPALDPTVE
jgi:hypothetical protein